MSSIRAEILDQLLTLMTAGFGFVAALAWNEAIQALFKHFFPERSSIVAMFVYAALVTVIAVIVTARLKRIVEKIKR